MSALAKQIVASRTVTDDGGIQHPLKGETSLAQCAFLVDIIRRTKAANVLEVGLAYGISSLFICDALRELHGESGLGRLISVDPLQTKRWHNVGITNLRRAGFDKMVDFHQEPSHNVLPRLLDQGVKLDLAYVDSLKIFDVLLVDAYFLARLLNVGGILIFDDCHVFPGVRRLVRYVAKWPHFKVYATHDPARSGTLKRIAHAASFAVPSRSKLLSDEVVMPSARLGVNAHCVAFQKIAEDTRKGDWHVGI